MSGDGHFLNWTGDKGHKPNNSAILVFTAEKTRVLIDLCRCSSRETVSDRLDVVAPDDEKPQTEKVPHTSWTCHHVGSHDGSLLRTQCVCYGPVAIALEHTRTQQKPKAKVKILAITCGFKHVSNIFDVGMMMMIPNLPFKKWPQLWAICLQVAAANRRQTPGEVLRGPLRGGRQNGRPAQRSKLLQRGLPGAHQAAALGAAASGGLGGMMVGEISSDLTGNGRKSSQKKLMSA